MKQVKCVITDDEPTACEGLQRYVEKVDFLSLMGVCEDAMQLNTLLQTEQPDLLFLLLPLRFSVWDFIFWEIKKEPFYMWKH